MTSRPLANSDKGVMRIVGISELMRLPPIVPVLSHSLCHSLFAFTPQPLKGTRSIFFFFLVATPQTLRVALYFLFIFCCLLLVPHLVIIKHHSLYHSLKSSLIFPSSVITPCPSDCAKTRECLYLSLPFFFHVQTWLEHTQKEYLQDRVVIQFFSF